ncbi:MAG: riboflavin biosynthesis protein RibF [Clostridia bacterium]|nr:riboflavin biosynthesis protein RibF [Clostridia bacterium]
MEIITELTRSEKPSSTALGYFDGIHKGHRAVIEEAVEEAKKRELVPTVFTLLQSPRTVLRGEQSNNIITLDEKLSILENLGIEQVYLIDFNSIKNITANDFVRDVLCGCFHARHVSCGFNYHFGAGAQGSGEKLEEMCKNYDITVFARPRITMDEKPISSTRIRECIVRGDITSANNMLGRQYGFCLPVIHGRQLGRQWGTPTLNQEFPEGLVKPCFGVYVSVVTAHGKKYCGVTNVGVKPTVGSDKVLIETWMPDYTGRDLYDETLDVRFLQFIRGEKKFSGIDELKAEILKNGELAKKIFQQHDFI